MFSAEYQFGTHQKAVYDSQFKGAIFPVLVGGSSIGISSEYQFGLHQVALYNSQIQPQVWAPLVPAPGHMIIRSFTVPPQAFDFTLQGSFPATPVATGWILTYVGAGPQQVDLTLQAKLTRAAVVNINAPWNPTTIIGRYQQDPTQLPPQFFKPPTANEPNRIRGTFTAWPPDAVQMASQACVSVIFPASVTPPKPAHYVQPVLALVGQQAYADIPFNPFSVPVIGGLPPPPPGPYVVPPYSIYWDYQPWTADTNRYTVDSANTTWAADGGSSGGGTSPAPVSNNPHSPKPKERVRISITQTLNTRF
jgi:hypothetical protein